MNIPWQVFRIVTLAGALCATGIGGCGESPPNTQPPEDGSFSTSPGADGMNAPVAGFVAEDEDEADAGTPPMPSNGQNGDAGTTPPISDEEESEPPPPINDGEEGKPDAGTPPPPISDAGEEEADSSNCWQRQDVGATFCLDEADGYRAASNLGSVAGLLAFAGGLAGQSGNTAARDAANRVVFAIDSALWVEYQGCAEGRILVTWRGAAKQRELWQALQAGKDIDDREVANLAKQAEVSIYNLQAAFIGEGLIVPHLFFDLTVEEIAEDVGEAITVLQTAVAPLEGVIASPGDVVAGAFEFHPACGDQPAQLVVGSPGAMRLLADMIRQQLESDNPDELTRAEDASWAFEYFRALLCWLRVDPQTLLPRICLIETPITLILEEED